MSGIMVIGAFIAAVAIFLTTPRGRALAVHLGLRLQRQDSAPVEDRDYLLRECGGDEAAVSELLDRARIHNSDMSEKEAYRKAIRTHLNGKR